MNLGYFLFSPAFITFPLLARLLAFLTRAYCPLFGRNLGSLEVILSMEDIYEGVVWELSEESRMDFS
jgi:hypothetical protein